MPLIQAKMPVFFSSPFGVTLSNRDFTSEKYRYGFQGQERDDEAKGEGNSYDFGARIYDPRIGRWLSIDPLAGKFPDQSPYSFAYNNPIRYLDFKGESPIDALNKITKAAHKVMNNIWDASFKDDKEVVYEVGFIVVYKKTYYLEDWEIKVKEETNVKHIKKSQEGGRVGLDHTVEKNEKILGDVHTHPYSNSEGGYEGVAFSSGDIDDLRYYYENEYVSIVEAGTQRFGLVVTDEKKAKEFFENNDRKKIQETWKKHYDSTEGTEQEKVKAANVGTLKDSGIEFYETTDKEKKTWSKVK